MTVYGPTTSFATVTVKRWSDEWLTQRQRTVRPGTFVSDSSAIHRWIVPCIGHRRLDMLSPADIRALTASQEAAGLAVATMQRTYAVLKKLLADAVAEGYEISPQTRETPGPGQGVAQRQAICVADAAKILEIASNRPDASRWVAALVEGLRPAEALGLTWEMLDLKAQTMTLAWQLKALPYLRRRDPDSGFRIPRGFESRHLEGAYHLVRPKTRAGIRVVPLVPRLVTELKAWRGQVRSPHGLVWPLWDGSPKSAAVDRQEWYSIAEQAGATVTLSDGRVRRPLLYEARHTAATLLLANGIDETTIKAILGHSSVLSTQAYLHTDHSRTRAALLASANTLGLDR